MEGKLAKHPLAELIREITATGLTGALRLGRERAKVAIYFESGQLVFATSNLRAHRLREVAMRNGLTEMHLAEFPVNTPDAELAAAMLKSKTLQPETLAAIRAKQVLDVLRLALLWVDGTWEFDPRVRLADETRVQIDTNRLLLECARHLPADFIAERIENSAGNYLKVGNDNATNLLPADEVLDVGALATIDEIKNAYHALALRFHPDRFHQSDRELRNKVESAFARIAQAYETLSNESLRLDYDANRSSKRAVTGRQKSAIPVNDSNGSKQPAPSADANRAETSFQHGLEALKRNRHDEAIRFLAEAAMLSPREARYRAHYGHALIRQSSTRRIAETELQAALLLEPENTSYRVMLAELYRQLGLRRRAEGELERALAVNPKDEAARALLLSLRSKSQKS